MKFNIQDLIDFDKVNALLEGFNQTTGFVTAILDLDGNVLSRSGWRTICTEFHRINPETCKLCLISDTVLANKMNDGNQYHFYNCLNGLVDVAFPVIINGEHVANLFSGQFFYEEPDREFFRNQARTYGFNEKDYLDALGEVPIVSEEKVKIAMNFLVKMTQLVSEVSYQKMEQLQLNEALRISEERSRDALDQMLEGCQIIGFDWKYIYVNRSAELHNRRSNKDLLGMRYTDVWPEVENTQVYRHLEQALKKRVASHFENEFIFPDGSVGWFDLSIQPVPEGVIILSIDNTERIQVEEELKKSESEFRLLAESMPQIVWTTRPDGWNTYFNQQWVDYTGLTFEESYGHGWSKPFHPDDQQRAWDAWSDAVENNGVYSIEARLRRADGVYHWWLIRGVPILDADGNILKWFGTCTSIHELKLAEEALLNETKRYASELEERVRDRTMLLEAANKELEAFSYSVSHDLRAPLRHINGYVELLNERFRENLPEKAGHYLAIITDAAKEMGILIDDLLQFSRSSRQEVRKEKLDMNALVMEVHEKIASDLKNKDIIWSIQELPEVYGDEALLRQVWVNLLDNAVKYSKLKQPAEISVECREEENDFVFCIRDNGVGFDMKFSHKLFGVFQRLHSQTEFEGTGIGLANVQRIINKHNGKVWAKAELNNGAAFYFSLPKNQEHSP